MIIDGLVIFAAVTLVLVCAMIVTLAICRIVGRKLQHSVKMNYVQPADEVANANKQLTTERHLVEDS